MDIKEPRFDRPIGLGATSEENTEPDEVEITEGKHVFLLYQGRLMRSQVTQVVKPDTVFVGRVLVF
jgi:hypothetical protein